MDQELENAVLLIDGNQGIYVPLTFALRYVGDSRLSGVKLEDMRILMAGPDHEEYWDAWDEVLAAAELSNDQGSYRLYQDGDLWAVPV